MAMTDTSPFEIHVCAGCAELDPARRSAGEGGGPALVEAIVAETRRRPFAGGVEITAFDCLGACARRGRASISSAGRWGIVFGGLDDRTDAVPLCDFIELWLAGPYGQTLRQQRPKAIRKKIIGRIPPPRHHLDCTRDGAVPPNQAIRLCRAVDRETPASPKDETHD